jgi:caffeoyl-CoA O-methyltransferase
MHKNSLGLSPTLYDYILAHSEPEPEILAQLRLETTSHPQARMQIAPDQGRLMALLVQLMGAQTALEIGVFTGYSSLAVALALPSTGRLIACDVSAAYTTLARHYWQAAGVADKIDLHLAPALQTLDQLLADGRASSIDFAFIDADKGNYQSYFDRTLSLIRPGGLIAIDNTLWSSRVVDSEDHGPITQTIRAFNRRLADDARVEVVLLPIADGLTLARKRN